MRSNDERILVVKLAKYKGPLGSKSFFFFFFFFSNLVVRLCLEDLCRFSTVQQ
jgi:hypothetical protein